MKKVVLLILVACVAGTAAFMFAANYFAKQQIESRLRELGKKIRYMGESDRTGLSRNWWATMMPPTDDVIPEAEYRADRTHGRHEWFSAWVALGQEAGGKLECNVENLVIGESVSDARFNGATAVPVTWTWHRGVPGGWGERVAMSAMFVYEADLWKIARLEERTAPADAEPPVIDPQ